MYFFFLHSFLLSTVLSASLPALRQSVLSSLKSIPKDSPFYAAASAAVQDFDTVSIAVDPCLFRCTEQLQQAIGKLRGFQEFALFDQKWTLWSVAHDQAVAMDRAARIYHLATGRPHRMNIADMKRSAYLAADALIHTVREGRPADVAFTLARIARPMRCVAKQSRGLAAMTAGLSGYDKRDWSLAKSALLYSILIILYLLIAAHIVGAGRPVVKPNSE